MTLVLIKLIVCPRSKDDHSGRLVVSQHNPLISLRPKAEQCENNRHRRVPTRMAESHNEHKDDTVEAEYKEVNDKKKD